MNYKFLLFTLFSLGISNSSSAKVERGLMMDYQIKSDDFNKDVPQGYFALKGFVSNTSLGGHIKDALITDEKENFQAFTDSTGYFELLLPIHVKIIYCYKDGLTEVAISEYEFENRHLIEVDFYLRNPQEIIIVTKPVIYLYNAPGDVELSLKPLGPLSFTYPVLNESWHVTTNVDGSLTEHKSNKVFPYLFWEGENNYLDFKIIDNKLEGYLIMTDTCISFMENILGEMGLTEKESTDFITFWGPKMVAKKYALIQFIVDDEYSEKIADLDINPRPKNSKRIYMLFNSLEKPIVPYDISAPAIQKVDREGYTLIEWGGSVLNKKYLLNI